MREVLTMDRMPPELYHQVCQYIARADLPQYRLSSLFHHIAFHASFASFDRVKRLARHSVLHKHIKKVI